MPTATPTDGPSAFLLLGTEPPAGTRLRAGQLVTISAQVRYTLGVDRGTLGCAGASQDYQPIRQNPSVLITRAVDATGQCRDTFTVPAAGVTRVEFFTGLSVGPPVNNRPYDFFTWTSFPVE